MFNFLSYAGAQLLEAKMKVKEDFSSSLNPLSTCLQFVGIPLNFSARKNRKMFAAKVVFLLVAIVSANFFINGPRGIEIGRLNFGKTGVFQQFF